MNIQIFIRACNIFSKIFKYLFETIFQYSLIPAWELWSKSIVLILRFKKTEICSKLCNGLLTLKCIQREGMTKKYFWVFKKMRKTKEQTGKKCEIQKVKEVGIYIHYEVMGESKVFREWIVFKISWFCNCFGVTKFLQMCMVIFVHMSRQGENKT